MTTDPEADWFEQAGCKGMDPELWFPRRGEDAHEALQVCWFQCPVRQQCLNWAIDHNEDWGIWGGIRERDRRDLRRAIGRERRKARANA